MSFASFPLEKLGLAPAQLAACQKAGFSVAADILLPSASDLNKKLRFPRTQQVHDLIRDVSRAIAPSSSRVSELIPESTSTTGVGLRRGADAAASRGGTSGAGAGARARGEDGWIRTGDEGLDQLLGGGLRIGCVTEITGESAAGKSHLCLCLAISAQLPALTARPGGTVVLTSERELATERLVELSRSFIAVHARDEFVTSKMMLDNIQTTRCGDIEALDHALSYVLPAVLDARRGRATEGGSELHSPLMGFRPRRPSESTTRLDSASSASRNGDGEEVSRSHSASASASAAATVFSRSKPKARPVRLLVIDSITALLRGAETSFSSTSAGLTQRSRHLCLIADKLKALAVEYELAVLVINQVSDVFSRPYPNAVPASSSSSRPSSPASASMGAGMSSQRQSAVGAGQWTASQHPGHSQAFYTEGDDPPMRYATQARWFSGQSRLLAKEASLGIVWANAINTRIMLSRTGRRRMLNPQDLSAIKRRRANEDDDGDGVGADVTHGSVAVAADIKPTLIRRAHLVFSPFAPPGTIDFAITPSGVHTLRDSYKLDEAGDAIRARTRAAMRRRQHEASDGHEDAEVGASTGRGAAGAATTRADDGDRGAGDGDGDGPNGDGDDDDEFGGDVFDDFGELPPEFWDGTWETPGAGDEPLATGVGVT